MEEMDFSHSSQTSWDLLRKLGAAQPVRKENYITANAVASNFFKTLNIKATKQRNIVIKNEYKKELEQRRKIYFNEQLYKRGGSSRLKKCKNGKAPGVDGILPDFIKNLGSRSKLWLARFFTSVMNKNINNYNNYVTVK